MRLADHDLGTPEGEGERVSLVINGHGLRPDRATHFARRASSGYSHSKTLLHRLPRSIRILPNVLGRSGRSKNPVSSCTELVSEGLVVRTETQDLAQLRRGVMELYISDHPLDCLTCSANGDCEPKTWQDRWVFVKYGTKRFPPTQEEKDVQPRFHL